MQSEGTIESLRRKMNALQDVLVSTGEDSNPRLSLIRKRSRSSSPGKSILETTIRVRQWELCERCSKLYHMRQNYPWGGGAVLYDLMFVLIGCVEVIGLWGNISSIEAKIDGLCFVYRVERGPKVPHPDAVTWRRDLDLGHAPMRGHTVPCFLRETVSMGTDDFIGVPNKTVLDE